MCVLFLCVLTPIDCFGSICGSEVSARQLIRKWLPQSIKTFKNSPLFSPPGFFSPLPSQGIQDKASSSPMQQPSSMQPVIQATFALPMVDTEALLRKTLQENGFGVLTEVDISGTLHKKVNADLPPHKVLGVCNPKIALAALQACPDVGAYLPCGVSLRQGSSPAQTVVTFQSPEMMGPVFGPGLEGPAQAAHQILKTVIAQMKAAVAH